MMAPKEGALSSRPASFPVHNCATEIWGSYYWLVDSLACLNNLQKGHLGQKGQKGHLKL